MRHQTVKRCHYTTTAYPAGKGTVDITDHVAIKSI